MNRNANADAETAHGDANANDDSRAVEVLSDPNLFMEVSGFLMGNWSDAAVLGAVSRGCRESYLRNGDAILKPILTALEGACRSNVHRRSLGGCG